MLFNTLFLASVFALPLVNEHTSAPIWQTNSIVAVLTFENERSIDSDDLETMNPSMHGCGVVITHDGQILTTRHLLGSLENSKWKVLIRNTAHPKGKLFEAKLIAADAWSDLAVLKIETDSLRPLAINEEDFNPVVNQMLSLHCDFESIRSGSEPKSVEGTIAKISSRLNSRWNNVYRFGGLLEMDCELPSAISGGAVIDTGGKLIGITTARGSSPKETGQLVIPYDVSTRHTVEELCQGRLPNYGYLGVTTRDLSDEQKTLHEGLNGVQIIDVDDRFGEVSDLRFSDVLTHFDGRPIESSIQLEGLIGRSFADREVTIRVKRGVLNNSDTVQDLSIQVVLSKRRTDAAVGSYQSVAANQWRGMTIEYPSAVEQYQALAMQIDPKGCVVVTRVERNSSSWNAGLRPMMIVRDVNKTRVSTPAKFYKKTNFFGPVPVQLTVIDSVSLEPKRILVEK